MYKGKLHIISCWNDEYEDFLRHNALVEISEAALLEKLIHTERQHRQALDLLVKQSGIGDGHTVHHWRGQPDEAIPRFLDHNKINMMVMGTVSRTGIPGFVIGNTAENIVRKIKCSLLAMKPEGFITPVSRQ